jgi:hypothetical protein
MDWVKAQYILYQWHSMEIFLFTLLLRSINFIAHQCFDALRISGEYLQLKAQKMY